MLHEIKAELNQLAEFWINNAVDEEWGGFIGQIDGYNQAHPRADKGVILNNRILWSFSALSRYTGDNRHIDMAHRAYQYVSQYFTDTEYGGLFWMLHYKGKPIDTKKQIYAQAFGIYAYSEYFLLTKDQGALDRAKDLYRLIEQYAWDQQFDGYLEAYSKDWELLDDLRLSEKDANEKKSMNTHLHVLEAYTNLYRCWPDADLNRQIQKLISIFLDHIIDPISHHLRLFFDESWNVKSHEISFGHDIEASWLLYEAAEVLGDDDLIDQVRKEALSIASTTARKAINNDGAMIYEAKGDTITDRDRHWWVQAEAIVGFINAYQLSGEQSYLTIALNLWEYIKTHLIDHEKGEWWWRTDHDNQIVHSENKIGPWKAPYHNMRMCLEVIKRMKKCE